MARTDASEEKVSPPDLGTSEEKAAAKLAGLLYFCGGWTDFVDLGDGRKVRAKFDQDEPGIGSPWENDEFYGEVREVRRGENGYSLRPGDFDGAARKLDRRDDWNRSPELWWQPPAGVDAAGVDFCYKRLNGWLRDDWTWAFLAVEVHGAACEACGCVTPKTDSLGGIESDADFEYLASTLADMIGAAQ